jgi:hypothetical protein
LWNSAVHWTRVKQRGSRVKPEVATISLAWGVFRGEQRGRIETEREQLNAREFPKTLTPLTPCASIHRCTHALELVHTTLSISCSTVSLWDLLCFQIWTHTHAFLSFFPRCTTLIRSINLFLFTNFYYLHQNLTPIKKPTFNFFCYIIRLSHMIFFESDL